MRGKHQNLPTNKLILVSQSGFYSSAVKKAQFYEIRTISLGEAVKADWTKNVGKTERLFFDYYENKAHYHVILKCDDDRVEEWAPPNHQVVFIDDRTEATINQVVNTIVGSEQVREHVIQMLDSRSVPKFVIEYCPTTTWHMLDQGGAKREVSRIIITLETVKERTCVPLKHGQALDYQVAFGEGSYSKGEVSITVLESEGQPTTKAVRLATGELQIFNVN